MRNRLGEYLIEAANNDPKLLLLSGDIGYGIFDDFIAKHPTKFINCGIAEQNMIGTAAGLSSEGYHVVVYTIIPFLLYRPYDFIRNLIAFQNLPVCLIGVGGGYSYDSLGFSHYAKEDLTSISVLPNFKILTPYDPDNAEVCFKVGFEFKQPTYIRLMKGGEIKIPVLENHKGFDIILNHGDSFLLLSHGSIIQRLIPLVNSLKNEFSLMGKLISIYDIDNFNIEVFDNFKKIIIVEEHVTPGLILTDIISRKKTFKFESLNFFTCKNSDAGLLSRDELLDNDQFEANSMKKRIFDFLNYKI